MPDGTNMQSTNHISNKLNQSNSSHTDKDNLEFSDQGGEEEYQPLQPIGSDGTDMSINYNRHHHQDDIESFKHDKSDNNDNYDDDNHQKKNSIFYRKYISHCRYTVDFLQGIVLPTSRWWCCSCCCTNTSTFTTTTLDMANHSHNKIYLIQGLDRVVFGTKAASECIVLCGIKPVRYVWYMLSGAICDMMQLLLDLFIHIVISISDPSLCWILSFGISIIARHTSHRYLVFGDYVGGYWKSLSRMYAGYSIIIVISTVFNIVMTRDLHLSHYMAWVITLLWTGIVNYFILKYLWTYGGSSSDEGGGGSNVIKSTNVQSPRKD